MVPVAQWLERLTVDQEVVGSRPIRHPTPTSEMLTCHWQVIFFGEVSPSFIPCHAFFMLPRRNASPWPSRHTRGGDARYARRVIGHAGGHICCDVESMDVRTTRTRDPDGRLHLVRNGQINPPGADVGFGADQQVVARAADGVALAVADAGPLAGAEGIEKDALAGGRDWLTQGTVGLFQQPAGRCAGGSSRAGRQGRGRQPAHLTRPPAARGCPCRGAVRSGADRRPRPSRSRGSRATTFSPRPSAARSPAGRRVQA